ncbi:YppG family protein [Sutcliffiella halmapala]|uniref:YppG family protein n=1 Tax=Sutcliffiella halmapala TaxID=79882 RepID=UPI001F311B42|nr:YppG family protein [Sutcliffiella halmapala]
MSTGVPLSGGMMSWNQDGNYLNAMNPNQAYQNYQGFPYQGFPFQNGTMPPNGLTSMLPPNGGNGAGMFPAAMSSPQMNNMQMPFMNPYPTQNQTSKPQSSQVQSFMNQFKGQDGNVDMKKMMDTAGQMMNTVNQLNSMVKGIAATFKA